ncbi:hypothetical protein H4N58_05395 [Mumia sp. ZJ1417]|uniref:hypothetical protein n=1 Tax=Mumia sp. ZJ1417 TaxID=2708082 RepID=UPI00141E459E|nr:hypothetical protein [Mumia sp. ZJ1417]QMW67346.1 hypothetical protein H4N58_05395 [Mumia sp. ZJ1417]
MRFKKTAAFLGATALILLGGPAVAGPPHNLSIGGSTSGTYTVTGTSKGAIAFNVVNGGTTVTMGCTSAGASGSATAGAVPASGLIATLASTTWGGCIGPGGLAMTVTQSSSWCVYLDPTTQTSNAALTDTLAGRIAACNGAPQMATVRDTATNGAICTFTVAGFAHGSFVEAPKANGTQDLIVNEPTSHVHLKVSAVTGCLGAIAVNNPASFSGTYNVNTNGPGTKDINVY